MNRNRIHSTWLKAHLGKETLDLYFGCLNRRTLTFQRYSTISPNLCIIGSQKCGTSSLAHYLSFHKDIQSSSPHKEPGFFCFNEWAREYWAKKGKQYSSKESLLRKGMLSGYCGQKYLLDSTTRYTLATSSSTYRIPEKVAKAEAKCLYIIRNPIERIISSYHFFLRRSHV